MLFPRLPIPGLIKFRILNNKLAFYQMTMSVSTIREKCLVGVVQMCSKPDKHTNFCFSKRCIEKASQAGAKAVFFPEACDFIGTSVKETLSLTEKRDGPTLTAFCNLARLNNIWLFLGLHLLDEPSGKIANSHVAVDAEGNVRCIYRKSHLFDACFTDGTSLCESSYAIAGDRVEEPLLSPAGCVGLGICYDLRFPNFALALVDKGANVLTFPSAFTVPTGTAHWETLLRARAIENQCYVIAAAQVGKHNEKRESYGHALVVDPWGVVVSDSGNDVGVFFATIDEGVIESVRQRMPVVSHRRDDLYIGSGYTETKLFSSVDIDAMPYYKFGQFSIGSHQVFARTSLSFACVNKKPVLPGHVLVLPLRHRVRLSDLSYIERADLFDLVIKVGEVIQKLWTASSQTVAVQDGPQAGQTVQIVHVHVIPRKEGDFEENDDIYTCLSLGDKSLEPEALVRLKQDKPNVWNKVTSDWRSEEDMKKESLWLRNYFLNVE